MTLVLGGHHAVGAWRVRSRLASGGGERYLARMRWLVCVALSLAVWTSLGSACRVAAQEVDLADSEARSRFEAGRAAMAAGRTEDALADFRRAYELSHRPALLYNIGVAADRLRHDDEALEAFEAYLAAMPAEEITNRAEVESRLVVLRETIASRTRGEDTREEDTRSDAPPATSAGVSVPGVALLVSGGVLAIGGAVLLGVGASERARVANATMGAPWSDYAGSAEIAPILEGSGGAALGVGAALAVTGAVLLAVDGPHESQVAVLPFGAGAQVVGRW